MSIKESNEIKNELKRAYQALLIVSLNQPLGDFYKNFSDEVKERALIYYNYTYSEDMVSWTYIRQTLIQYFND